MKFDNERFMNSLQYTLREESTDYSKNPEKHFAICHTVFSTHAPKKKKYISGNNKPFITKTFSKAIMQGTRFRNKFLKNPTDQNKLIYNKQRNNCEKKNSAKLNEKGISNKRKFWHTVKPFLSDKAKSNEAIILVSNENTASNEKEVANFI